ncbi:MAG: penicillin-binding protein [Solirubrobacteraceae bacterium]|nr:penicillin-binding protein [Solirubrobacteraceae bacterium]
MVVVSSRKRPSLGRPPPLLLAALAAIAVIVVLVIVLTGGPPAEQTRAQRFVAAWARADYRAMHAELTPAARAARPLPEFTADYRRAAGLATATAFHAGKAGEPKDGIVSVPMTVTTRVFGLVRSTLRLPFSGEGDDARVAWSQNLTFPGVQRGQKLDRSMRLPRRADILARDGTPLAAGEDRGSPLGAAATAISGALGPVPPEAAERQRELGVPGNASVGLTGLERVFQEDVAGRPGGTLRAGARVLASSQPRPAPAVRTSIDPKIQRAAVEALGAQYGGVAVLRPRSGEILGLAGVAFSSLQPPGSTFKIVTLSGALEHHLAGPRSTYPVQTGTELEGVEIENANGESCGGSLRLSFAHSCNSVFAPLGARMGPGRLVKIAEAFGFNQDLGIPGAATSSIPAADEIGDALAVGSSAIGQGRVQATALQMAWVASTIADGGRRVPLTLRTGVRPVPKRVLRPGTARIVRAYMESVVQVGTGRAAAISGVRVAGKTGTAELKNTSQPDCTPAPEVDCPAPEPADPTDTDAWFAAFAPANRPRVAVAVLLIANGAGGDTAAPVARQVLSASLKATG